VRQSSSLWQTAVLVFIILNSSTGRLEAGQKRTTLTAIKAKCSDDGWFGGENGESGTGGSVFSTLLASYKESFPEEDRGKAVR